jgi:DNA-binding NarL/FixJ family response regulator
MRVVICDHHAVIRDGLRQMLRHCVPEADVVEAANYSDAFGILAEGGDVHLVVIEPGMPGMEPLDGLDAIRRQTSGLIAVLSGIEDRATIRAVLGRGIAGYISKRLGMAAITSALRLVLAGETFVPSLLLDEPETTPRGAVSVLTPRERTVLSLLRDGHSNKGIARHLNLSEVTIKTHLSNTFRKLGVRNRVQAAQLAG